MINRKIVVLLFLFFGITWIFPIDATAQEWKSVISPDSSSTFNGTGTGSGFVGATGDSSAQLAAMAKKYATALGLVVLVTKEGPAPVGTSWAVAPNLFATNAHVAALFPQVKKIGGECFVVINKQIEKRYRVTGVKVHPQYGATQLGFDGKESFKGSYDVALMQIDGKVDVWFPLAEKNELKKLDSGYRIAYLGFPMEGLVHDNINVYSPVATMKTGIVTSMTDYTHANGGFDKNFLIHHDMGATGGASGSPLFNTRGEVVGLLNAGNIVPVLVPVPGEDGEFQVQPQRTPSGALINFGQRVDLLYELFER